MITRATLQDMARALHDEVHVFAEARMSPMALKTSMYVAELSAKGRDASGRARRSH